MSSQPTDTPSDIAAHIGSRIRSRRRQLRMDAAHVAGLLRITASRLHGYEAGRAELPARALPSLAAALAVPVDYFYRGLDAGDDGAADDLEDAAAAFTAIRDGGLRTQVAALVRSVANVQSRPAPPPRWRRPVCRSEDTNAPIRRRDADAGG